jgi:hypothetical protein
MRSPRFSTLIATFVIVTVPSLSHAQWVQTNGPSGGRVHCFALNGTILLAGTDGGVYLSADDGSSWTAASTGLTDTTVTALAVSGTNLFAGTWNGGGVFLSTNGGSSWSYSGLTNRVVDFGLSGTSLFAGTYGGVFISTNDGSSWTGAWPNAVWALAVSGAKLYVAAYCGYVYLSTNNGSSWMEADYNFRNPWVGCYDQLVVNVLAASDTNLFAGTADGGVFLTTNRGTSWTAVNNGLTNGTNYYPAVNAFAFYNTDVFAGTDYGVFLSTDCGSGWSQIGLSNNNILALAVSGSNLFAGTGSGVWRRPLSEIITSVSLPLAELPTRFSLNQNYPNPFNPSTTIRYELARTSNLTLRVYDILGREVSVLVNERKNAGAYEVKFDASRLASGVYLCQLWAGDYIATTKMFLVK